MKRLSSFLLLLACACGDVPVDDLEVFGGTAPEPTGVIRGTVLYNGPPPICVDDENGNKVPKGQVVLTLFEYDNPPPPTGSASSAANLLTIPALSLFSGTDDCLPDEPRPEDFAFITRTAQFEWPELGLERRDPEDHDEVVFSGDYQIRGFYDYDGNFNPFFSVTNLPTRGDIAGGAFVDPNAEIRQFRRIAFGTEEEFPNGEVINGVSVALGAPVNTERPVFYMTSDPLDSAGTIPATTDLVARENGILSLTNTTFHLYDAEKDSESFSILADAFAAAGMPVGEDEGFDIGDGGSGLPHAWYVREVDADGDGVRDPHPILGAGGAIWLTPVIIMQRARTEVEVEAKIPAVTMIPTVSNVSFSLRGERVFDDEIAVGVPPIAAVTLNPADARCRVPYIPSGNTTSIYERITVECQEVPTGDYDVNAIQGLAGARPVGGEEGAQHMCTPPADLPSGTTPPEYLAEDGCFDYPEAPPERDLQLERCDTGTNLCAVPSFMSETGWELEGGSLSGQAWGIPNALGDPNQLPDLLTVDGDPTMLTPEGERLVEEQGAGGRFTVQDLTPAGIEGGASCTEAVDDESDSPTFGMVRPIAYRAPFSEHFEALEVSDSEKEAMRLELQRTCCSEVCHLCDVPLCEVSDGNPDTPDGDSFANPSAPIRSAPTSIDADGVPNCVPFAVPDFCCQPDICEGPGQG